jgi:NAD(P)H-hydrate epimerase
MKVFTAQQMRDFDRAATDEYSIPSIVLMENAALRVVEFLEMKFAPLQDKKIIVLCGKGNNGGDGFAIARHLAAIDGFSWVFLAASPDDLKGDARTNFLALQQCPFPITEFGPKVALSDLPFPADRATNYIIVDALLGSGFRGEIEDERHISMLASLAVTNETVVAVDLPSGLNADDGRAAQRVRRADYTVTFAAPKRGMFLGKGPETCGEIWVGDIGTSVGLMIDAETDSECITREMAHRQLPWRSLDAHKGDAGRVVICGGSYGMSGAPTLASRAALRVGAGLCITCLPDKVLPMFASCFCRSHFAPLVCDDEGRLLPPAADAGS